MPSQAPETDPSGPHPAPEPSEMPPGQNETSQERLYVAGDAVEPGVYEEVSRGMLVELDSPGQLPNLNRPQPSRFVRLRVDRRWWTRVTNRLCGWMWGDAGEAAGDTLLAAGEVAPPGVYREVERGIVLDLAQPQRLPDFQTPHPSLYRRVGPLPDASAAMRDTREMP
jgi:hypothetical protein